ncbi:MAG: c-type cytochrome biogenesis protein CcsB [Oscillatoriales cyanobacterium RM2_1_1]|nr:c-type cytochrome biogenesis protein CcsB [Oscillatoriales cyanobacterium SM2_3_0]NJO46956.1 c-type cytochrome biogenesis protein CcsB [Oscillatoriales cyanobacterium RM2_1_1]
MDLVALQNGLDNLSFAMLLITMLIYWVGAAFPKVPHLQQLGTTGVAIANLCMTVLLISRWIEAGYFPISNLYESLFFLAWGITTVHLLAENMSRSRLVGVVTTPVAMAITAFAALTLPAPMQMSEPLVPALKSNWLMMHVSVMMISYATLMVGALMAIAFLVITRGQEVELSGSSLGTRISRHQIKTHPEALANSHTQPNPQSNIQSATPRISEIALSGSGSAVTAVLVEPLEPGSATVTSTAKRLSPQRLTLAETIDNISYRIIGLGFPLLTIGIIAGAVWANEAWGSYWSWDPKETWALITWLVFAAYLHARITRGWQGRKPAILAASGFVVVWVCYLGVNLLGKGLHSYGWFL